jgi:ABC-type nitrate/sulfonate/bicarbonate transport system substrate-binding protein
MAAETLSLGFLPLIDAAPLIVAKEQGFAEAEGLRLRLVRETSWANIRDRVALGHFDGAHMLAPMPIAATLGLGVLATPMIAPFAFGFGGNAITLSVALVEAMGTQLTDPPALQAQALARVARDAPLRLAVVHPFSAHNYELRYWLAFAGLDPDRDAEISVLPPPFMAEALAEGRIDGFCAGEPWGSLAVEAGVGAIVAVKSALWRQGPDKVLGLRADAPDRRPLAVPALLRALHASARWAADPLNRAALAETMAREDYIGTPAAILMRALEGRLVLRAGEAATASPDFMEFHAHAANFPWRSHALWFAAQMARWGQVAASPETFATAAAVYRPDLYRAALAPLGVDLPRADSKVEGALTRETPVASRHGALTLGPDGFFDGRPFDPDAIDAYLASFRP